MLTLFFLTAAYGMVTLPIRTSKQANAPLKNSDNNLYIVDMHFDDSNSTIPVAVSTGSQELLMSPEAKIDCKEFGIVGNTDKHCQEDVTIAGLTAHNQTFVLRSVDVNYYLEEGILGLGPNVTNSLGHPSILTNMKAAGEIQDALFSLYLSDNNFGKYAKTDPESALIIGGVDLDTYSTDGTVTYMDIVDTHGWGLTLSGVTVGNKTIQINSEKFYIDSGTSGIVGPSYEADNMMHDIANAGSCQFLYGLVFCDCDYDYPNITMTATDGFSFIFTPAEYFWHDGDTCHLLINGSGVLDYWILGDAVMRRFYTIFDVDNQKIGFALAKKSIPVNN